MNKITTWYERLKEIQIALGITTQKGLAAPLEMTQAVISKYYKGEKTDMPIDLPSKLKNVFPNVNVHYLKTGEGTPLVKTVISRQLKIPLYNFAAAKEDDYSADLLEDIISYETYPAEEIARLTKIKDLHGIKIEGSSMEPMIYDGSIVLFHRCGFTDDGIYVFQQDNLIRVKQIQMQGGKALFIKSINPQYQNETLIPTTDENHYKSIETGLISRIKFIGRVLIFLQRA